MEFKDKLKELRTRQGISQTQLAKDIFVSRSAVAKWENGLGLPGEESMEALLSYFGVSADYFSTEEPESVIVEKNQRISRLSICLISVFCVITVLFLTIVGLLIGGYRFTSASAVDEYYHQFPTIRTEGYNFYLNDSQAPTGFEAVKIVNPWLFKNVEAPMQTLVAPDGRSIGGLFIFRDGDGYHHFFCFTGYITDSGYTEDGKFFTSVSYPYRTGSVTINGTLYELDFLMYCCTPEPIRTLVIKGEQILITDSE